MELLLTTMSDWIKIQSRWKTLLYLVPLKGMSCNFLSSHVLFYLALLAIFLTLIKATVQLH